MSRVEAVVLVNRSMLTDAGAVVNVPTARAVGKTLAPRPRPPENGGPAEPKRSLPEEAENTMAVQRRYAVLIGVDTYEDRHAFPALKYCTADCKLLQQALVRAGGFSPENMVLLVDDSSRGEHLPRRNNLIAQVRGWAQRPGPDDLLLLAFCGHAREIDGSVYLLPSDARAADLPMTALPVAFLKSALQASPARSKVLFLDACHSGSGRDVVLMTASFMEQLKADGAVILSACKVNEVAHECDAVKQGVFSYYLARGLNGEAADPSGVVTCDGLYGYVHREVVRWSAARGLAQTPWRWCEGVGDPVLIGRPALRARSAEGSGLNMPRFHYGSVVPPEFYIDREKELREALELIDAGQSFLLVGDRRSGKTSFCKKLIHQLMGRPDNTVLASYLNLQRCHKLRMETFLQETFSDMIGEIARQVFRCKFTDLLRRHPVEANLALRDDPMFEPFLNIFRLARKQRQARGRPAGPLGSHDFVRLVNELLEIIRAKGWSSFVLFYDEANRLPGSFPVEMLMSNVEALQAAGVISVYAASPDMAESFAPLHESFYDEVCLGSFADFEDMRRLLARYYFGDTSRTGDLPLTAAALDLLWGLTHAKPYLIQLVAGHGFRCALERQDRLITQEHVQEGYRVLRVRRPEVQFGEGDRD
jgi:hypothetical protein